jgi:putative nucleotidyltransferase with HDIG domain
VSEPAAPKADRPWAVKSLQPLPVIAVRLMRMMATDDVVFQRVADLIRSDVSFSAEVLRVANSPLIGHREEIRGIMHAMALMGLDRLKGLVMTVALRNFLAPALHMPGLLRCWRHSLAAAAVAEELAIANWMDKDRLYTAALLHDLGRLAVVASHPDDYVRLLEEAEAIPAGSPAVRELERKRFGADHQQVGQWLSEDWGFPQEYQAITGRHHDLPAAEGFDVLTGIQLSCRIAHMLGFQAAGSTPALLWDELKECFPGCSWDRVKPEQDLAIAVAGRVNALECSLL